MQDISGTRNIKSKKENDATRLRSWLLCNLARHLGVDCNPTCRFVKLAFATF